MDSPPPSPNSSSPSSSFHFHFHSSNNSFPVIAIALIGILATAFLLIAYYVFVIKCCLNWHRIDFFNRFTNHEQNTEDPISNLDGNNPPRGLDEAVIRSIPVIKFKAEQNREKNGGFKKSEEEQDKSYECAVCLSEFQDGEKLRVIPICCHAFHIDCIDIWLQSSDNCPLCRSLISPSSIFSNRNPDNFTGNDDDYVVIEIQGNNLDEPRLVNNGEKTEQEQSKKEKGKIFEDFGSVGDEWIEMREKDEGFRFVQPIRRSISMDLSIDREFCIEIQDFCKGKQMNEIIINSGNSENCSSSSGSSNSSSSKVRRSIFSFGYGRNSRGSSIHNLDP